jgi:hypothetical protein
MISTGCHLKPSKWKECADCFYSSPPYLQDIYRADEKNAIRRIKEKYSMEYKRVCGTMGWRDYNLGNLSAMETGDLGPIEVRMKQLIQEEDDFKMGKEAEKARTTRLASIETNILSGHAEGVTKIKKAKLSNGTPGTSTTSIDEVNDVPIFCNFYCFIMRYFYV